MRYFRLKHSLCVLAVTAFLFSAAPAPAHEGEEHGTGGDHSAAGQPAATQLDPAVINTINNHYLRDVKPIFKKVCFDCHSEQTRYPSYYVIPGVRQLIDWDIREARKHIDMNADFPFKGHGTPLKDLKAIKKEIDEGDMPPLRYKILHWNERLTGEEEQVVQRWTSEGIMLLSAPPVEPAPAAN